MSDFSFVPLRPFFCAAFAKRRKVQFRQGFAYFNNIVDSKRHIVIGTAILCIYIYILYYIYCIYYIYMISRRSITPQHIKYNSKSLDVVQSLYFGSKLSSSGTYK